MAAFSFPTTVSMTGVGTTNTSNLLTVANSTAGSLSVAIGASLTGLTGVADGTTIIGYNSGTQAIMSANATATNSGLTCTATNPAEINFDQIAGVLKTGGDTYVLTGLNFTMDQHSRHGLNSINSGVTAVSTFGNITPSGVLGGDVTFDGRYVRLIPYNGASGNLPTLNSTVSQGSASGKLIAAYSALTAAPTLSGAIPASGFLLIKGWNGVAFTSGAMTLSGIAGLNATGTDRVGWIEICGDDASTFSGVRLGKLDIKGAWFDIGTTDGNRATTYQLPNNGLIQFVPAIWVQGASWTITAASWADGVATYTAAGHDMLVGQKVVITGATPSAYNVDDVYITDLDETAGTFSVAMVADPDTWTSGGTAIAWENYPCAGTLPATAAAIYAENTRRGKVFWNTDATTSLTAPLGYLRFGHDGTNSTGGYCPPSGRKIRIGNIFLNCNTAAERNQNVLPNATLATRYDLTMTAVGRLYADKVSSNWYFSINQAQLVQITDSGFMTRLDITEIPTPLLIRNTTIGQEAAVALQVGLYIGLCYGGVLCENVVATAATTTGATGHSVMSINQSQEVVMTDCVAWLFGTRSAGSKYASFAFTPDAVVTRLHDIAVRIYLNMVERAVFKDSKYTDSTGIRVSASAQVVVSTAGSLTDTVIDGLKFVGYRAQPYSDVLNNSAASRGPFSLRNMGTLANPLLTGDGPYHDVGWSRTSTTITVTQTAHGLVAGDFIRVFHTTSTGATNPNAYTILAGGLTADTFTFTAGNSGDTSGTLSYYLCNINYMVSLTTNLVGLKLQRCYPKFLRGPVCYTDNSCSDIEVESSFATFDIPSAGSCDLRSITATSKNGGAPAGTASPGSYGVTWLDGRQYEFPDSATGSWTRSGTDVIVTLDSGYANQVTSATPTFNVLSSSNEAALNTGLNYQIASTSAGYTANKLRLTGYNTGATSGTCTIATETGRVQINMNEASSATPQYELGVSNSVGAGFTGGGGLMLPAVGDTATFESPYWIRGHVGFMIAPPVMGGGTIANYNIEYQIDTGAGYSGWKTAFRQTTTSVADILAGQYTVTGLSGTSADNWIADGSHISWVGAFGRIHRAAKVVSGGGTTTLTLDKPNNTADNNSALLCFNLPNEDISDYETGFRMKVRITTIVANVLAITYVAFKTFQSTASRGVQWPLDVAPINITVKDANTLVPIQNARVRITTDVGGFVILSGLTDAAGVITGTTEYTAHAITGTVRRATVADGIFYKAGSISGTTTSSGFTSTILMIADE